MRYACTGPTDSLTSGVVLVVGSSPRFTATTSESEMATRKRFHASYENDTARDGSTRNPPASKSYGCERDLYLQYLAHRISGYLESRTEFLLGEILWQPHCDLFLES